MIQLLFGAVQMVGRSSTPVLVLRFDADNAAALKRVQDVFREQLLKMDSSLPLPF